MTERWKAYDPGWLVDIAREQHADKAWLASALSACTRGRFESRAFVYFVDNSRPNKPGARWQFRENILLTTCKGEVVLDVLEGNSVGGAEFLWLL